MELYDKNLVFKASIGNIIDAKIEEGINAEYTLTFTTLVEAATEPYLNENHIVKAEDNYFNIAAYAKRRRGAARIIEVECEHVSYDLNDETYDKEYFVVDGTPNYILGKILEGTGFTAGAVEFATVATYSAQEKLSRRCLLMEFASYIGAEIKFDKYSISLLQRRGADTGVEFKISKNIRGIEKYVDARKKVNGQPLIAYDIDVVELRTLPGFGVLEEFALGDTVRVLDSDLGIDTNVRVVKYQYDPIRRINSLLEIQNNFSTLSDTIFRIQRDTVIKGELYYGARISPEHGFESIRSDKMARTVMNADEFAMQVGDGSGTNWANKIYFDPIIGKYVFDGELSATMIEALEAQFDVTVSNVTITNVLAAETGYIAQLTVDQLDTSTKVQRYLAQDTSDVNYIKIYEQRFEFIEATTTGAQTEQATDRHGSLLYWKDDDYNIVTLEETDYPVLMYVYTEKVKLSITFEEISGVYTPKITMGLGDGVKPMSAKAEIFKGQTGLELNYYQSNTEALRQVIIDDTGIRQVGNTGTAGLRNIAVQAAAPASPQNNDLWIDTSGGGGG